MEIVSALFSHRGVIALGLGSLPSAQAAIGQCEPAGSTMGYHFTFNQLFDHPDKNTAGKTFYEVNKAENVWQNEGTGIWSTATAVAKLG